MIKSRYMLTIHISIPKLKSQLLVVIDITILGSRRRGNIPKASKSYAGLVVPSPKLKISPLKKEAPGVQQIPQPTGTSSQLPS